MLAQYFSFVFRSPGLRPLKYGKSKKSQILLCMSVYGGYFKFLSFSLIRSSYLSLSFYLHPTLPEGKQMSKNEAGKER